MRLTIENKEKLYFSSDHHFHHKNIIEFCNRPWGDSRTMDEAMIVLWNQTVPPDGIVFYAGDFIFTGNLLYVEELVKRLNGTIHLIYGNHDYQNKLDRTVAKEIFDNRTYDVVELTVKDESLSAKHINFFISHYPHMYWHRGSYHLYGHVHGGPESTANEKVPFHFMRYDIGVDNNNYKPISYFELLDIFNKYEFTL